MRAVLDASVIVRLITADDPAQTQAAVALFQRAAQGKLALTVTPPVLFEVAWTLRRAYAFSRETVLQVLSDLLSTPGLSFTDQAVVERALSLAKEKGLEFADSYIAAAGLELGLGTVATFNPKDFKKAGLQTLP